MRATKLKQKDPALSSGSFSLSRLLLLFDEGGAELVNFLEEHGVETQGRLGL